MCNPHHARASVSGLARLNKESEGVIEPNTQAEVAARVISSSWLSHAVMDGTCQTEKLYNRAMGRNSSINTSRASCPYKDS